MFFSFAPGTVSPCPSQSKPQAARASQPHRLAELLPGEAFVFVEGMAINIQGGAGLCMTQQACHRAHVHALGDEHTGICVPLRYNKDKSENPLLPRLLKCLKARKRYYIQKNPLIKYYMLRFLKHKNFKGNLCQRRISDLPPFFFHYNTPFGGGRQGGDN